MSRKSPLKWQIRAVIQTVNTLTAAIIALMNWELRAKTRVERRAIQIVGHLDLIRILQYKPSSTKIFTSRYIIYYDFCFSHYLIRDVFIMMLLF